MVFSPQESRPVDDGADKGEFKVVHPSSTSGVLVFSQALFLLNRHKKNLNVKVSYKIGMPVAFAIQKTSKVL